MKTKLINDFIDLLTKVCITNQSEDELKLTFDDNSFLIIDRNNNIKIGK